MEEFEDWRPDADSEDESVLDAFSEEMLRLLNPDAAADEAEGENSLWDDLEAEHDDKPKPDTREKDVFEIEPDEAERSLDLYGEVDSEDDDDTLVIDALEIGLMLFRREPEAKMKQTIRAFAGKYGLLGIMTALPTTAEFIEYEKVYVPKNPFLRKETMETTEYFRQFFPFIQPDFRKKGVESVWQTEDKYEIAFAMTFQSDPQAKAMSFMRNYGERYDWLFKLFKDWAFLALTTRFYMDDKKRDDPDTLALYRKGIAAFEGIAPTYRIELRDKPTLVWDFHSLLLDIRFLLTVMLTDDHTPLRLCRHCYKPFIAKQPDDDYCCDECRNSK